MKRTTLTAAVLIGSLVVVSSASPTFARGGGHGGGHGGSHGGGHGGGSNFSKGGGFSGNFKQFSGNSNMQVRNFGGNFKGGSFQKGNFQTGNFKPGNFKPGNFKTQINHGGNSFVKKFPTSGNQKFVQNFKHDHHGHHHHGHHHNHGHQHHNNWWWNTNYCGYNSCWWYPNYCYTYPNYCYPTTGYCCDPYYYNYGSYGVYGSPIYNTTPVNSSVTASSPVVVTVDAKDLSQTTTNASPVVRTDSRSLDGDELREMALGSKQALSGANLGEKQGRMMMEVGDVALGVQVDKWSDRQVSFTLPMFGLAKATEAKLHLLGDDGNLLQTTPVKLVMPARPAAGQ